MAFFRSARPRWCRVRSGALSELVSLPGQRVNRIEILGYLQRNNFEWRKALLEAEFSAIEEMPGRLMQRLQESGVDEDVSAGFEDSERDGIAHVGIGKYAYVFGRSDPTARQALSPFSIFVFVRQKRSERMAVKIFPSRRTTL